MRKVEPQPASVSQLVWPARPQPASISLPSGAFCEIHKVHTDQRGWLVLHSEIWESQADYDAGKPSAMQSDHDFGPGHEQVADLLPLLLAPIDAEFAGHRGDRRSARVEGHDRFGMLKHPHVATLGGAP